MSNLFEKLRQLERLDQLIRLKATGCPKSLSRRLEISERKVYRLISELKEMGFPIEYCKSNQSYYYEGKVSLSFQLMIDEDCFLKIKGGFWDIFDQTDKTWQWGGVNLEKRF